MSYSKFVQRFWNLCRNCCSSNLTRFEHLKVCSVCKSMTISRINWLWYRAIDGHLAFFPEAIFLFRFIISSSNYHYHHHRDDQSKSDGPVWLRYNSTRCDEHNDAFNIISALDEPCILVFTDPIFFVRCPKMWVQQIKVQIWSDYPLECVIDFVEWNRQDVIRFRNRINWTLIDIRFFLEVNDKDSDR